MQEDFQRVKNIAILNLSRTYNIKKKYYIIKF